MYQLEAFMEVIDNLLNTPKRRHAAGGILISLSALFAGLAVTALTMRPENKENDEYD